MNDPSEIWFNMQSESSEFFHQPETISIVKLVQLDSSSSSSRICRKNCTN